MTNTSTHVIQLSELLEGVLPIEKSVDRVITGLSEDSRTVQPGDLFFARAGSKNSGNKFIDDAISKGAAAVIAEENANFQDSVFAKKNNVPILFLKDLAQQMGPLASRFYGYPSRDLKVIGITGTNGKTSCAHFIAQALEKEYGPCGVIGTIGNGLYGQIQQGELTTPEAFAIQRLLADFKSKGVKFVVMEVTSHSLVQGRVNGVAFDIAAFTNLSRDHLDYHGDITTYAKAKRLLFDKPGLQYGILNIDDPYGEEWLHDLKDKLSLFAYSIKGLNNQPNGISSISASNAQLDVNGITASIHTPWGDGVLHNSRLIGQFTLSNFLVVITVLGILGLPLEEILARVAQLQGVPGRMETFGGGKKPLVIVDFAHTPAALEEILRTLRQCKQAEGRLWCVFGCGGDRDRGKRSLMGSVAAQYADQLIITDDNPRSEDPKEIVAEIMQGLVETNKVVVEHDRRRAIEHAISCARMNDIVLIAGRGHETHQIIGSQHEPFSDAFEVQKFLM